MEAHKRKFAKCVFGQEGGDVALGRGRLIHLRGLGSTHEILAMEGKVCL